MQRARPHVANTPELRHGQRCASAVAYLARGGLEVVDAFKRLRAARELG